MPHFDTSVDIPQATQNYCRFPDIRCTETSRIDEWPPKLLRDIKLQ